MTSPVSVGDVIAVSKLAIALGRAFTKGRKSAPAEFREVENQLYSLSAALDALASVVHENIEREAEVHILISPRDEAEEDSLSHAISSCRHTLTHLETVITRYGVLKKGGDTQTASSSWFKGWGDNIKVAWKSVIWTTEGGDLATLRSNLTIHTNSLNLLLGVLMNSQTGRLQTKVDQIHTMLHEVQSWLSDNLPTGNSTVQTQCTEFTPQDTMIVPSELYFELWDSNDGGEVLACRQASLLDIQDWEDGVLAYDRQIFRCNCPPSTSMPLHKQPRPTDVVSPLSFCSRIASGKRVLMLYKIADNDATSLKTVLVKKIPLRGLAELEEFFLFRLPLQQSRSLLLRNMSTMLCYVDVDDSGVASCANVLHLTGDIDDASHKVTSVTFENDHTSLRRDSIDAVQVLHYKSVGLESLLKGVPMSDISIKHNKTAEVAIFYRHVSMDGRQADDDMVLRTTLNLTPQTKPLYEAGQIKVILQKINGRSYGADETAYPMPSIDAVFEFRDARYTSAASTFFTKVENMRMVLFIISLHPRQDERVLLKVLARNAHTENLHIAHATILILQNKTTKRVRLLIVDKSGYCIISQDLAEDFVASLSSGAKRPNLRSLTYVVQMDSVGTRKLYEYPRGFEYLNFFDASIDRLFHIGLAAIAGTTAALPDSLD